MVSALPLSRPAFRTGALLRDGGRCVHCGEPATEVHHIMERRLFADGGYYLDNGASLCNDCHRLAEQTLLTCAQLRREAGITRTLLPPQLEDGFEYDKWGNLLHSNGTRSPGELFGDPSVQKILGEGGVLDQFVPQIKYPRTPHLPWSPGASSDDLRLSAVDDFVGKEVICTEKLDGECTTLYPGELGMHARSINSGSHPSRTWVKQLQARIAGDIPSGWRLAGENLQAKHSIHYTRLPRASMYFFLFAVYNDHNLCLSWDQTCEWAELLGLVAAPVLYRGFWDEAAIRNCYTGHSRYGAGQEGYVVRLAKGFPYACHRLCVAKYVRSGHVTTSSHWRFQTPVPNEFAPD